MGFHDALTNALGVCVVASALLFTGILGVVFYATLKGLTECGV